MRKFVSTKFALNKVLGFLLIVSAFGVAGASTPCTQNGFEEILDDMIGTGGQYLEVFPVNALQFPDAFTQAERSLASMKMVPDAGHGKGIYVVTNNLKGPRSILPASIYSTPYVNGVTLMTLWNQIEPSPGIYDWSVVDLEIERAVAHNKKITISVTAGAYTPTWLYRAPYDVPHATFLWGNHDGAGAACTPYVLPAAWATQYVQAWRSLMSAFAAHLQSIPGAYAATARVRLTGINTLTDELHLAFCSNSGGKATWQSLGYTPNKLLTAAKAMLNATNDAFPNKILSLSIIEAGGLPLINDAGEAIANTRDPSYVNVKQELIDYALSPASGISDRFAVQWNGFQSVSRVPRSVVAAGKNGAIIGWETNEFGGLANGAECP